MSFETVLAVIVLFNRKIEDVPSLGRLKLFMAAEDGFCLKSCLVYDNSPVIQDFSSHSSDESFCFVRDPLNGGTRGAYLRALQVAQNCGYRWILFLDHDTDLPVDFFQAANVALSTAIQVDLVCAVVPLVFDGGIQVSPTLISTGGKWGPWSKESGSEDCGNALTAISSAALVRVESLASVLPIPECFSLDYLDHWLFRAMQGQGEYISVSTARVAHSLSVQSMRSIDSRRYRSILIAEFNFLNSGDEYYSLWRHVVRLFLRALKLIITTRRLDLVVACCCAAESIFRINKSNE